MIRDNTMEGVEPLGYGYIGTSDIVEPMSVKGT